MPTSSSSIQQRIRRVMRSDPPRSKSLIVTLFGDSLLPYISSVWLGDLIHLLQPFGVNAQLARTSCFRLAEEGWLQSAREGRSSRYGLTESGARRVEHAYHRIYATPEMSWDGNWTIVIPGKEGSSVSGRAELRRELEWAGFGRITAKLFIHPTADLPTLKEVLTRLGLARDALVLRASGIEGFSSSSVHALTAESWNLPHVADLYKRFLKQFEAVLPNLDEGQEPETAFLLQTLLIHSYRRVVLHDPRLPAELLPANWPGHMAYDLCRTVYRQTYRQVHAYLEEHLRTGHSGVLRPSSEFTSRFGGLK